MGGGVQVPAAPPKMRVLICVVLCSLDMRERQGHRACTSSTGMPQQNKVYKIQVVELCAWVTED